MKKFSLFVLLGLFMSVFAFTACGSDDNDDVSSNPLIGKWVTTEYGAQDILEFKSNGTGYFIWNSEGGRRKDFTYTYDATTINFFYEDGHVHHPEDYHFEGNNLIIDEVWIKQR